VELLGIDDPVPHPAIAMPCLRASS
jgi:hypothetical protein